MRQRSRLVTDPGGWWIYLALGGALTAAYYLAIPYPALRALVYTVIGLSALIAIGWDLLRNPQRAPWAAELIGLGVVLYFMGDLTYTIYRFAIHAVPPYPGIADAFFLLARIPLFAGMLMLARHYDRNKRPPFTLLDTLIVACGLLLLWWSFLLSPLVYNSNLAPGLQLVSLAYPALDFLLLAGGIRLIVTSGRQTAYHYLVGASFAALLVADVVYSGQRLTGNYHVGTIIDAGWIWFYVLIGAAALFPHRAIAPEPTLSVDQQLALNRSRETVRLGLLTVAVELLPIMLAYDWITRPGHRIDPGLIIIGAVLIMLVMLRIFRLMRSNANLQAELARLKSDVLFRSIVERAHSGVSQFGPDLSASYHSPNMYEIADISAVEGDYRSLIHPEDQARFHTFWLDTLDTNKSVPAIEYRLRDANGEWVDVESLSNNLLDDEWIGRIVLITRNISARKQYERQLRKMAYSDYLTDAPNRAAFDLKLHEMLEQAHANGRSVGLIFIDLDGFGPINDNYGHTVGDDILKQLARRLADQLYEGESLARFGGDEFIVASPNMQTIEDANLIYQRIMSAMNRRFSVRSFDMRLTACAGVAMSDANMGADELVRNADLALRQAKNIGQGTMRMFTAELLLANRRVHALSTGLRSLLADRDAKDNRINYMYMPITGLKDNRKYGLEVPPTWRHPDFGLIENDELSIVASDSNLMYEIEFRTISDVARLLYRWRGLRELAQCRITINVSDHSFTHPQFDAILLELLGRFGILPSQLTLEVDEMAILRHQHLAIGVLSSVHGIGVDIVIDHFAREYSSVLQLQRLPHAAIKYDPSLIRRLGDEDIATTAQGINQIAHELDRIVIADGVDSAELARNVRSLGFDYAQGLYFGSPLAVNEAEKWIKASARVSRAD